MPQNLVIGNWKMHGSKASIEALLNELLPLVAEVEGVVIGVCPTAVHIAYVEQLLKGSQLRLGAQNVHFEESGAYTGEWSADMLTDYGVEYVLVGHSERRASFAEADSTIAAKFAAVRSAKSTPVLCVGETLEQRQQGVTSDVVLKQLDAVLNVSGIKAFAAAVIAYEPVWAIGTGETASPEQAQEVHSTIRSHLAKLNSVVAKEVSILYGGSVNSANAKELFAQNDIDGGLVGGASLKAKEFAVICQSL